MKFEQSMTFSFALNSNDCSAHRVVSCASSTVQNGSHGISSVSNNTNCTWITENAVTPWHTVGAQLVTTSHGFADAFLVPRTQHAVLTAASWARVRPAGLRQNPESTLTHDTSRDGLSVPLLLRFFICKTRIKIATLRVVRILDLLCNKWASNEASDPVPGIGGSFLWDAVLTDILGTQLPVLSVSRRPRGWRSPVLPGV